MMRASASITTPEQRDVADRTAEPAIAVWHSGVPTTLLPSMTISGGSASNIGTAGVYQLFADTVIQAEDTVILTLGKHTMRAGFQVFRDRLDTFYSGNNGIAGTFTFNGQYSGAPEADFLLGLPSAVGVGTNGGTWDSAPPSSAPSMRTHGMLRPT